MEISVTLDPPGTEKRCKLKERACAGSRRARPDKATAMYGAIMVSLPLGGRAKGVLKERRTVSVVRSEVGEMIRCGVSKIIRLRTRMDPR